MIVGTAHREKGALGLNAQESEEEEGGRGAGAGAGEAGKEAANDQR